MSLDQPSAIPVDTHIWQIATRDYKFKHKGKKVSSLTKDVYNGIGDLFRGLWGEYAGWAHSVLFTADLRVFREYEGVVEMTVKVEEGKEGNEELSGEVEKTKTTINGEGVKKRKVNQVLTETLVREKRRSVKNLNGYSTAYEKTTIVRIHENKDGESIE
jgi:N-glycosylase/DNA lyase